MNSKNHFLYTEEGRDYLVQNSSKSTYEIAKDNNTYAGLVRRAMIYHGLARKTRSEAQKAVLERGGPHPTKGKKRPNEVKQKIAQKIHDNWKATSNEEKERRRKILSEKWKDIPESKKEEMRRRAAIALRETTKTGSKLERSIHQFLLDNGIRSEMHRTHLVLSENLEMDILLPEDAIVIECDGPFHFTAVHGQEDLWARMERDERKNGLLLDAGFTVIRIKYLSKSLSDIKIRNFCKGLLEVILDLKVNIPENKQERLIFLNI